MLNEIRVNVFRWVWIKAQVLNDTTMVDTAHTQLKGQLNRLV